MSGLWTRLVCAATALATAAAIAACGSQKSSPATSSPPTTTTTVASSTPAATSTAMFEVTGTGQALTIDTDPADPSGQARWYEVQLPWQHSAPVASDVSLLQVVAVGKDDAKPGCRITLDGKVVAEEPVGGSAHCVYQRP